MTASRWRIHYVDTTTSTNDDARRAVEAGEAEGYAIIATTQTTGRGRQGRVWESASGNLFCSVVLKPKDMPISAGLYSFVAALAVHDLVASVLPRSVVTLKWPNDVLVGGKKISGILLEVCGDKLIMGIGVNVVSHPENTIYPTTSLTTELAAASPSRSREGLGVGGELASLRDVSNSEASRKTSTSGPPLTPPASGRGTPPVPSAIFLLDKLLEYLAHYHALIQSSGFASIRAAWLAHAQQGSLTIRTPQETLQGTFAGLTENGHLLLQLEDGAERAISTGDVFTL